jgi:hypothetical protein
VNGYLRDIKELAALYLQEVIGAFGKYIDEYQFLAPDKRPAAGAPA